MRVSPLGLWARDADEAADAAAQDSALSHPHPVCVAACAAYAAAIHIGVAGGDPAAMFAAAQQAATAREGSAPVLHALGVAQDSGFPDDYISDMGWVLIAFQNAFAHLAASHDAENALIQTVGRGGDTDTNAAIAGALLGAANGCMAFPARWRLPVLACRPLAKLGARQPRPAEYWPADLPRLAEALVIRKLQGAAP